MKWKKTYHSPQLDFNLLSLKDVLDVSNPVQDGDEGFTTEKTFSQWW